jgi:hypothetical protein
LLFGSEMWPLNEKLSSKVRVVEFGCLQTYTHTHTRAYIHTHTHTHT